MIVRLHTKPDQQPVDTVVSPLVRGRTQGRANPVHTAHTTNPVPLVAVRAGAGPLRRGGSLRDVAPTVLALLGIASPTEMTGRDLRDC